jgi:signal transduction histidine kinase
LVSSDKRKAVRFLVDFVIILLGIGGLYNIHLKAALPFKLTTSNFNLIIEQVQNLDGIIAIGDTITAIDGHQFNYWEEVELYLDGKNKDKDVTIKLLKGGVDTSIKVQPVEYYKLVELIVTAIVGFLFIGMAIFVRIKAPGNKSASIFYWAGSGLGLVIMMTAGNYTALPFGYGYVNRIVWLIAYNFISILFIQFVSTFIIKPVPYFKPVIILLYSLAFISAGILSFLFLDYAVGNNFTSLKNYIFFFDSYFRLFLIASVLTAISLCIYAFKYSISIEERKKLRWLLLGFFGGPFIYVILWTLPIYIFGQSPIPETLSLIVLIAIPITFSIAIVRYHFMNVNVLIRRSFVYSIILVGIVLIYIGLSALATLFVPEDNPAIVSIVTAVVVAILLQPVKSRIQKFVDKRFFRLEYNYREEQKRFLADMKNTHDIETLANKIVTHTDELIPVEKIGFFLLDKISGRVHILAHKGFEILVGRSLRFDEKNLKTDLPLPVAVDDQVEKGVAVESADLGVFRRWGIVLIFPIKSPSGEFHAFLVLGAKKSGARFFKEDVDLINTVTATAALTIDRVNLQEDLIRERLETERLDELNKMKSYFVSTVTHELKTPLTSIKMFAELLQSRQHLSSAKSGEYLQIIEGESERLERLINNVLDFAKIEKGIKTYKREEVNICELVKRAVSSIQYQFKMAKINLLENICDEDLIIKADSDAVEEAVVNLLSNAIKYSPANSSTTISTFKENNNSIIKVKDEGIGISAKDLKDIFEPYFRTAETSSTKVEGTGLGLAIVKHIMDAHNGRIKVESSLNKGSTFSLIFPMEENK